MPEIDFVNVLKEYRDYIFPELMKYLGTEPKMHWDPIREYPLRKGKYVRPVLLMLSAEALGATKEQALKAAIAMQLSEEWLLIHDDWEDGSEERRGKPCLHRMYYPEIAMNAGDELHNLMWKALADSRTSIGTEKTFALIDEMNKIISRTTLGQTFETTWTIENKLDFTDENYYYIVDGKTVYYTIAGPLRLGAIVAGINDKTKLDLLYKFGEPLGRGFQIQDDVLNLIGDREQYGKEIGGDILEGKRTLMFAHLIKNAQGDDKEKVIEIYSKMRADKTNDDIGTIIDLMNKYGSIDYARKIANELCKKSLEILEKDLTFIPEGIAKDKLRAAAKFMVERKK